MVGIPTQEVKPFKMVNKSLIGSTARIAYNYYINKCFQTIGNIVKDVTNFKNLNCFLNSFIYKFE